MAKSVKEELKHESAFHPNVSKVLNEFSEMCFKKIQLSVHFYLAIIGRRERREVTSSDSITLPLNKQHRPDSQQLIMD